MCPAGSSLCGGTCVNLQSDPAHCGSCTTPCTALSICASGACGAPRCVASAITVIETEPNDTPPIGNPLAAGTDGFSGAINPVGDVDYYTFIVSSAGASVWISVGDGDCGCPVGFDSIVTLYDSSHTLIASDDNGGPAQCSRIDPMLYPAATGLAPGTYAVRVQQATNSLRQPAYVVEIHVTP